MRRTFLPLLIALAILAGLAPLDAHGCPACAIRGLESPPARDPGDLIARISAAASKGDRKAVRAYLVKELRVQFEQLEELSDLQVRINEALDRKFGKVERLERSSLPMTRELIEGLLNWLYSGFAVELKESKIEGDRAILKLQARTGPEGDQYSIRTFAVKDTKGWKLFLLPGHAPEDRNAKEVDFIAKQAELRKLIQEERQENSRKIERFRTHLQAIESGAYRTREDAEKAEPKERAKVSPRARSVEELIERVSAAALDNDWRTLQFYLTDEIREFIQIDDEWFALQERLENVLEQKFGEAPKKFRLRRESMQTLLLVGYHLKLKESKIEGKRATLNLNLTLSARPQGGPRVKTFAVQGPEGWKLFLAPFDFFQTLKNDEVDLTGVGVEEKLRNRLKEARQVVARLRDHVQAVEDGKFKSREQAEKATPAMPSWEKQEQTQPGSR